MSMDHRDSDCDSPLPSFLVIGGQRCGSSWVHKCLAEHPGVFVATPKELHFFNRYYDRGVEWYRAQFHDALGFDARGEVTPDYIADENTAKRVYEMMPGVRLVAVLREPIERAYSLYQLKRGTSLNYPTFEAAIENHPEILDHGLYAKHLTRWASFFSQEQILVLLYNDLVDSDADTIARIFQHIGADRSFVPSWVGKTDNATILPTFRRRLQRIGLEPVVKVIGRSRLGDSIRRHAREKKHRSSTLDHLAHQTRTKLENYYREPNRALSKMLNRVLPGWPM